MAPRRLMKFERPGALHPLHGPVHIYKLMYSDTRILSQFSESYLSKRWSE